MMVCDRRIVGCMTHCDDVHCDASCVVYIVTYSTMQGDDDMMIRYFNDENEV